MKWLLLTTALLAPTAASAAPITALFIGLGAGAGLAAVLTNITVSLALNAIGNAMLRRQRSQASSIADARVNVRMETPIRWQMGGTVPVGGAAGIFSEHDDDGNFWYIIAHGDGELTGDPIYFLDDVQVALSDGTDGFTAGDVITDEFCIVSGKGEVYTGTGTKVPMWRLYTVTPDVASAYGALPAAFTTAFPGLPADFNLAGVVYTIVRGRAPGSQSNRNNSYHWRGPIGLGEPSVVMMGNFNRMYDPREVGHDINDSTTWTASDGNAAIVAAWFRTSPYGQNRPMTEVAWADVEAQADICDLTVLDRDAVTTPFYRAGYAFPDNKPRAECLQEILDAADAISCYDDQGRWYPKVGYYTAPTLEFSAARDILGFHSQIIDDGDVPLDGVIVNYLEPSLNYTKQPCAPWQNPDWFDAGQIPNYHIVDVLTCQNHNQAVRLAKAIGTRIAPLRRASIATTIKGILASNERAVTLTYDSVFDGAYEIVDPIRTDEGGMSCAMTIVPIASDKWTLGVGEEGVPPSDTPDLGLTPINLTVPDNLEAAAAVGGVGQATVTFTTANDPNQYSVAIYRGATTTFSAATLVHTAFVGPNVDSQVTETGLAAGTWRYWAQPLSKSASGTEDGPHTVTVT